MKYLSISKKNSFSKALKNNYLFSIINSMTYRKENQTISFPFYKQQLIYNEKKQYICPKELPTCIQNVTFLVQYNGQNNINQ